jgi:hypothetical protein
MKTLLRRVGIIACTFLSILLWMEVADASPESGWTMAADSRTFILGSSMAALFAMIISELSAWGQKLADRTRQDVILAELSPHVGQDACTAQDGSLFETPIAWSVPLREAEVGVHAREWTDVQRSVEVEGSAA